MLLNFGLLVRAEDTDFFLIVHGYEYLELDNVWAQLLFKIQNVVFFAPLYFIRTWHNYRAPKIRHTLWCSKINPNQNEDATGKAVLV